MALCLAESLVHREGHDPADQMRRYVRWWRHGHFSPTGRCFDIGITTRSQLARFEQTGEPHDPHVDEESAANGSLMRLAPVAIRWSHDPAEVVKQAAASSRPAHPASRPVDACKVLAAMTAALIRGEPREAVLSAEFWQAGPLHPAAEAVARGSWQGKEPPAIRGTGYCVAALEAAIAGQLAGALFGANGIPQPWLEKLAMRERIASLADALHRAAYSERLRWDSDLQLHSWWADAEGRLLAGEYPGHGLDVATTRKKLALLARRGSPRSSISPTLVTAWLRIRITCRRSRRSGRVERKHHDKSLVSL